VSLVAALLEERGIATVALSVMPELSARLAAPRTLLLPFGLGAPVGPAGEPGIQEQVVLAALELAADPGVSVPECRPWTPSG